LGRTGLQVSAIGLGAEHLYRAPQETVTPLIHAALDRGVTYFDTIFAFADYRDTLAAAFRGRREEAVLVCHLGCVEKEGQYLKTHNPKLCEQFFLDYLSRFATDRVDVLMLHNVNTVREYEAMLAPKGQVELAHRYRREGTARCIGMSGHDPETFLRVVQDGVVDLIMFPINVSGAGTQPVRELLRTCGRQGVGVVAMKVLGGGKLLSKGHKIYFPSYQTGGKSFKQRPPESLTPVQCISYALSQTNVATALIGLRSLAELDTALTYLDATEEGKDFSQAVVEFREHLAGECVYCDLCLPCPVGIDVGAVVRLVDISGGQVTDSLRAEYATLTARASACTRCGACIQRCPFGVEVLAQLDRAVALFGE
jgi:hypothetical protein